MPRASTQQHATNSGEFSPLLYGRQDLDKYKSALATCYNALSLVQGPWTRRGGSVFLFPPKFGGTKVCRLIPFQYNVNTAYMLEFGDQYIRFYTDNGILINASQSFTGISAANPGVVTKAAHGYSNGDRILIITGGGVTQLTEREVIVANKTANTFELTDIYGTNINTTNYDAYSAGGTMAEIFEIASDYVEADLFDLDFKQSADVLYLFHSDYPTATLVRTGALAWSISSVDFEDGPYLDVNVSATTLTLSATTGSVTVTASAVTGINGGLGFLTTDVGRLIRWKDPANNWTWLEITARASTTSITASILGADASATTATINWRLGAYSATTGYATTGLFYEDRFWMTGVETEPQRFDGSQTGNYDGFAPSAANGTVAADNAISFSLASTHINSVVWMQTNEKGLLAGTVGGEWIIRPSDQGEALTPTNITAKQSSTYGSHDMQPVKAGNAVLFTQRGGKKIRELTYLFEADGFRAPDMTLLSEHITRPGLIDVAYQQIPQSIIWYVRSDGALIGFTYERDQEVLAWHRHNLSGDSDAQGNGALVESIATVPSTDGTTDEVYMVVKRYINGRTERYIEFLAKIWERNDDQEEAFHVDCGTTYVESPAVNELTGLWYLEGETLSIWADGTVHPDVTVVNGKVTLNSSYNIINIGYQMISDGVTLPWEGGAADGSAQGKKKNVKRLGFWLMDTLGLKFGKSFDVLTQITTRRWGDTQGQATPLYTGVVRERFEGDTDLTGQVYFRADSPAPATVLAIMPQGTTEDDS